MRISPVASAIPNSRSSPTQRLRHLLLANDRNAYRYLGVGVGKMDERKGTDAMNSIERCHDQLHAIEDCIYQLSDQNYTQSYEKLSSIEKAKLDVGMAYGLASLLYITLRSQGVPVTNHPIKEDLNRIKKYVEKIKEIENPVDDQRKTVVNSSAAKRVVSHQIGTKQKKGRKNGS